MIPKSIRVMPLSKTKERSVFGTIDMVHNYFLKELPSRKPPGRFNIPSARSCFARNSLILFQYAAKKGKEQIIGHAIVSSDGYVHDDSIEGYIGYYIFDPASIMMYCDPVSKEDIYKLWKKLLCQSKLDLDVAKYDQYIRLLESKKIGGLCLQ